MNPDAWWLAVVCGCLVVGICLLFQYSDWLGYKLREQGIFILVGFSNMFAMITMAYALFNLFTSLITVVTIAALITLVVSTKRLRELGVTFLIFSGFGLLNGVIMRILILFGE